MGLHEMLTMNSEPDDKTDGTGNLPTDGARFDQPQDAARAGTQWEVVALTAFLPESTGLNQPVVLCLRRHVTKQDLARFEVTTCVDNLEYLGSEQDMRDRFDRTVDQHQRLVQATGEEKARLAFELERERSIESMLREELVWAASDQDHDDEWAGS
jgi:hypothetical protein